MRREYGSSFIHGAAVGISLAVGLGFAPSRWWCLTVGAIGLVYMAADGIRLWHQAR